MKKINILMCVHKIFPEYSGIARRAYGFARRTRNRGLNYFFLSPYRNETDKGIDFKVHRLNLICPVGLLFPAHMVQAFIKVFWFLLYNRKNIDVIHIYSFAELTNRIIALLNGLIFKKKAILEITLDGVDDPRSLLNIGKRNKLVKAITMLSLRKIDYFIVQSPRSVDSCINFGIDKKKIWLRPNPVEKETFGTIPFSEKNKIRNRLKLDDRFILLNVGLVYTRKNQLFLLKCLKELKDENILLLIIGPTPKGYQFYKEKLEKFIRTNDLINNIKFIDEVDNVNEYMIASDLFVFSSKAEGFGTVFSEAIMSGLPVLTTFLPGVSKIFNKKIGIMIYENNEKKAVNEFKKQIQLIKNLKIKFNRKEIRDYAIKKVSSKKIDNDYINLYNKLLSDV